MQVGRFYEFYNSDTFVRKIFRFEPLKPNKRGVKYGFPLHMEKDYAKKIAAQGISVVFIREEDKYFGRIKCRLPSMKISAV